MIAVLLRWLQSRRFPAAIFVIAALLAASSLSSGRTLDDWMLAVVARGEGAPLGLASKRWDCFTFTTGDALASARLIDRGILLPWWSDPELKLAFFRPLSAATHVLDEALWPNSPLALHVHSLLWFGALLLSTWKVYQRLAGGQRLANLGFALYALDDAHGATVGWIANRNALISATFGCACLWAHDVWRRDGSRGHAFLATLCFALSCFGGELGVATLAFLIAYAGFFERSALSVRLQSLLAYLACAIAWRSGWSLAGYGARGSGAYLDPVAEPVAFLARAPHKWLSLLQGQLGLIPADFAFLGSARDQRLWVCTGLVTVICAAFVLKPCIDDREARFWLGGALLALAPMAASFPSDRLLLFVGLGVMPLFARAFLRVLGELAEAGNVRGKLSVYNALTLVFFGVHALLAPLLLPLRAGQMGRMARAEQQALQQLVASVGRTAKTLIVLNAPSLLLTNYAQLQLAVQKQPLFGRFYVLSATDSVVKVTRSGARELTLSAEQGFLHSPLERHYRAAAAALAPQRRVSLSAMEAEVRAASADGRPSTVRFTLRGELSDYVFDCWSEGGFRPCELPPLGKTLRLAPLDLGLILFGGGARH